MGHRSFEFRSRLYPSSLGRGDRPARERRQRRAAYLALALLAGGGLWGFAARDRAPVEPETAREVAREVEAAGGAPADVVNAQPRLPLDVATHTISRNETFYDALIAQSLTPDDVWSLVKVAKPFANLSRVRPGSSFSIWRKNGGANHGEILSFQMQLAPNKTLLARPLEDGAWSGEIREIPYTTELVGYTGNVKVTLWEAAVEAGMDPNLIADLADVFAFDIDFNTEVRSGDRFRLVIEQKMLEGKPAGYGKILAAEYMNRGESHAAILYESSRGELDWFAADGSSLRRLFLRSPLRYRRISSRFGKRFHPVHKTMKAHQGIDYAADRGTPVRAVGDALVLAANWNGGSGNFVKLRHNSTYETSYSHLSGYGPGVKKGTRVRQGQIIGYVGTTGTSTGPHLHFAFYENGRYIDPLSKKFPAAEPVPEAEKIRFDEQKKKLLPLLPKWPEPRIAEGLGVQPAVMVAPHQR